MCGRYALYTPREKLIRDFSASLNYDFGASYNISPTATIAVLIALDMERLIVPMRWGLIPSWHKDGNKLSVLNNAKLETVETKPSFRSSFRSQRCLILADGFYEWDSTATPKQPYYFHRDDNAPIALAGIWNRWVGAEGAVDSCCIITEAANEIVSPVHDRMPGIILPEQYNQWLDTDLQEVSAIKMMAAMPSAYDGMGRYPVTPMMNKVAFDNALCIKQIWNFKLGLIVNNGVI